MKDYKLTVIMSNYNQEKLIHRAIKSVLEQETNFDFKIIITDDNSTKDNSINVISEYEERYENIEGIYATKNGGYLTNILRAKEITKTPYFCLLDADDYWTDMHWLQKAYDFLEKNPDYVIYEANVEVISDNPKGSRKTFIPNEINECSFCKEDMYLGKKIIITQTTGQFFRNVIFKNGIPKIMNEAIGTLSERSFEGDTDRFMMHFKYGKAHYCNEIVGVYSWSSTGIWARLCKSQMELISARSYMDYYYFYEEHLEYFVNKSWKHLVNYFDAKKLELVELNRNCLFDSKECENYNNVYNFCLENESYITPLKKTIKEKIKNIVKVVLEAFMK